MVEGVCWRVQGKDLRRGNCQKLTGKNNGTSEMVCENVKVRPHGAFVDQSRQENKQDEMRIDVRPQRQRTAGQGSELVSRQDFAYMVANSFVSPSLSWRFFQARAPQDPPRTNRTTEYGTLIFNFRCIN
eukprot:764124-Hanusia_phi.AAC.4